MQSERPHRRLRVSDHDRDVLAEILRQAAGDGRLDMDELDSRLGDALSAQTYADLDSLVADLPVAPLPSEGTPTLSRPPNAGTSALRIRATLDDQSRSGRWRVPDEIVAEPIYANIKLNFLHATAGAEHIYLTIKPGAGNVLLIVPDNWAVDSTALTSTWGSAKNRRESAQPAGPVIHVSGNIGSASFVARGPRFFEK